MSYHLITTIENQQNNPVLRNEKWGVIGCAYCNATGTVEKRGIFSNEKNCPVCKSKAAVRVRLDRFHISCNHCCGDGENPRKDKKAICLACHGIAVIPKHKLKRGY